MGPITYSLCQKPIIGVAMWITSLCAFPPLFSGEPLSLASDGTAMSKAFTVPVDKAYALEIEFEFPSTEARLQDQVVGSRHDENCRGEVNYLNTPEPRRVGLGRPIPFKVIIRRKSDGAAIVDRVFNSLCVASFIDNRKSRTIGWVTLDRGDYVVEVTNLQRQDGLDSVKTGISLVAGYGK